MIYINVFPLKLHVSSCIFLATDLKVDGGYGAMSAEGLGETSVYAGTNY